MRINSPVQPSLAEVHFGDNDPCKRNAYGLSLHLPLFRVQGQHVTELGFSSGHGLFWDNSKFTLPSGTGLGRRRSELRPNYAVAEFHDEIGGIGAIRFDRVFL